MDDPNQFNLESLLASAGRRMRADLEEQLLVTHCGEKGKAREEIVRDFLRSHLPRRFDVESGFACDSSGRVSRQLDIVIVDAEGCPRFETAGGIRFFPCESVVAVGQLKSRLTSRQELRSALDNLESAKALDRSAGGGAFDNARQEPIDNRSHHLHQIFTFLFVAGETLTKPILLRELVKFLAGREPHLWPNLILALDKYLVTYCCPEGVCPNPMDAQGLAVQPIRESASSDLLLRFYLLLGRAIEVTRISGFPHRSYLRSTTNWTAEVHNPLLCHPPTLADDRVPVLSDAFELGAAEDLEWMDLDFETVSRGNGGELRNDDE